MDLENEGGSSAVSESASSTPAETPSSSGYSVTDPGYDSVTPEPVENELEALKAENTTEKPPSEQSDDASGDTEEETETESPAESASPDGISDELLDRATELGYTLDEIKGFRSEKSLAKEIDRVEKLQQRLQARQASKTPAASEDAPAEEAEPEPNWDELVELGHDPDMVALQKKSWQRAAKAEELVRQMVKSDQDRAWTAQCERFDDSLNQLGDEFKSILGTGRRGDLVKSSPELAANRDKVFAKMIVLKNGYQQMGVPVPAEADLIQEAVQASFWKQTKTIARKELKGEIKKAGSQALSRPHSTGTKPLSGPPLAMAKEAEFWKKHS